MKNTSSATHNIFFFFQHHEWIPTHCKKHFNEIHEWSDTHDSTTQSHHYQKLDSVFVDKLSLCIVVLHNNGGKQTWNIMKVESWKVFSNIFSWYGSKVHTGDVDLHLHGTGLFIRQKMLTKWLLVAVTSIMWLKNNCIEAKNNKVLRSCVHADII